MTRAEQETTLSWSAEDDMVSVYTAHLPTRRKLERAGYRPWKAASQAGAEVGWFYQIPIGELRWRAGAKRPRRQMTEAEREAAARRLASARLTRDSY